MTLSFRHARQASGITIGSEDSISWVDVDESDPLSSGLGERACFLDRLDMSGILLSSKLKSGRRTEKRFVRVGGGLSGTAVVAELSTFGISIVK